jgi:hypothetical protein
MLTITIKFKYNYHLILIGTKMAVTIKDLFEQVRAIRKETSIVKIELKTAKEVFKEGARTPERVVAVIYTEVGREAHAVPRGIIYENDEWKVVDEFQAFKSVRNPNSWWGKFYKRYNDLPRVGMKVITTPSQRGFAIIEV